jgi:hypothetical protein
MDRVHLPPTARLVALLIGLASPNVTAQQDAPPATPSNEQEFRERLEALAKAAPPNEPLRGDHWIRGRVVTEDGAPLAGVRVRATKSNPESTLVDRSAFVESPNDESLGRSLLSSYDWWRKRWQNTWETTTTADGTYVFEHVVDGRFEIEAWSSGYSIDPAEGGAHHRAQIESDETADFVAYPTVRHEFDVRMAVGTAPERVLLQFERVGGRSRGDQETWTPSDRFVSIPAGDWKITAYASDPSAKLISVQDAWFVSPPLPLTVQVGATSEGTVVKLVMRGVPAIEGLVRVPAAAARSSFSVVAIALAEGEKPDPARLSESMSGRVRGVVRASMQSGSQRGTTYRIGRIDPGRWFVALNESGVDAPIATRVVEVGEGVAREDFAVPARTSGPELLVRVLDPAGVPLRDCEFDARVVREESTGSRSINSIRLEGRRPVDGSFVFARDRLSKSCTLFAKHPRFGSKTVEVPPDAKELLVKFLEPASPRLVLDGFERHARGRRVAVEVSLDVAKDFDPRRIRYEPDMIPGDGTFDLGRFQPGVLRVRVFVANAQRGTVSQLAELEVASSLFELAAGPRKLTLPFSELGTVRVATDPKERASYTLFRPDAPQDVDSRARRESTRDDDGILTFVDVPAGTFELRGPNGASMLIETPVNEVVRFGADPIRVLRVVIRDPKGAHARAGLKDGDRIVAIDGREFESRDELLRIRQSLKGETVTLTVQRKDERFEIEIETRLVTGAGDPGGYFLEAAR